MKHLILGLVLLVSFVTYANDSLPSVVVFGQAEALIPSDEWEISFDISLKEKTKEAITTKYNSVKNDVYERLEKLGIKEAEIRTENFSLSPWYEWENNSNVKKGYTLNQGLKIKKDKFELMGKMITALGPLQGVNVGGIAHLLKTKTREKELNKLYASAFSSAETKVEALLSAAGKKLKRYELISEDLSEGPRPQMREMVTANMMNKSLGGGNQPTLQLSLIPLDVPLSMQLKVIANFE